MEFFVGLTAGIFFTCIWTFATLDPEQTVKVMTETCASNGGIDGGVVMNFAGFTVDCKDGAEFNIER